MGAADPLFSLSCASTSVASIFPVAASAFEAAEMIPSCSNVKGLPVGGVFLRGCGVNAKSPGKGSPRGSAKVLAGVSLPLGGG